MFTNKQLDKLFDILNFYEDCCQDGIEEAELLCEDENTQPEDQDTLQKAKAELEEVQELLLIVGEAQGDGE